MKAHSLFLVLLLLVSLTGCTTEAEPENLSFSYRGLTIAIDTEAAPVLEALGEPKGYTEEASCAFEGLDKTYYYGSFYLTTYPRDGTDYIAQAWFADDTVTTREGLYLGAAREDAARLYGDFPDGQNACTLVQGKSKLTILLEGDVVTSIQYDKIFS